MDIFVNLMISQICSKVSYIETIVLISFKSYGFLKIVLSMTQLKFYISAKFL